jgi:hypothetical protein
MIRPVRDLAETALAPQTTFRRWLVEPRPVRRGLLVVAGTGVLYALTSLGLAASGAVPLAPLVLRLPDENHYFWQMVFVVPGFFLAWMMASGLLRLAAPAGIPGKPFRDAAALAGPSLSVPLIVAWVPQAVQTVLMVLGMSQGEFVEIVSRPGLWQVLYIAAYAGACVWAVLLFGHAARISQSSGRLRSGITGLLVAAAAGTLIGLGLR